MAILFIVGVAALVVAWLVGQPAMAQRRRRRLRALPFPAAWREVLARRVPAYSHLPPALRRELERRIQVFVAEKDFIGCAGQPIDDEVRVTIAAQASLVLLGHRDGGFPMLRTVLVYPGAFLVEKVRPEPSGVLQETRQVLAGESWTLGHVVFSWEDVLAGAADPADGRNVVIHELAHQLDQAKGHANGAPPMPGRARRERWARVLGAELQMLRARLAYGAPGQPAPVLDPYAASDPAEFFAVASEVFFELPQRLHEHHPALFAELAAYYRIDPRDWSAVINMN